MDRLGSPREVPARPGAARDLVVPYVIAIAAVVAMLALSWVVPSLRSGGPFLVLLTSVAAVTWRAGVGPGALATLLAASLGPWLDATPAGARPESTALVRWLIFVLCALVVLVAAATRRRADAERLRRVLEREQGARGRAEAANQAKDAFLAAVAHELRTPLTPILGWVSLLRSGRLDAGKTKRALETIERNTRSEAQLVDDLLDLSRIAAGRFEIKRHPVELHVAVEAAVEAVRPSARSKGVMLEGVIDRVGRVAGDVQRLEEVTFKLVGNAVKFTPKEGRVEVLLDRVGMQARLRVRDTGRGIGADALPSLFDPFRRADSDTTRPFGGLGMSLAIVRHVVELHGGSIAAESRGAGDGSTFTVLLPLLAEATRAEGGAPSLPGDEPEEPALLLEGIKVLIVDDEDDSYDVLSMVLEESGARVVAVSSAEEAIRALPWVRPDVLVSDIAMPDEDGYALIRRVRSLEPRLGRPIPAVAVSAYADDEDRAHALEAGFQCHLGKPFEPRELVSVVARLTDRSRS